MSEKQVTPHADRYPAGFTFTPSRWVFDVSGCPGLFGLNFTCVWLRYNPEVYSPGALVHSWRSFVLSIIVGKWDFSINHYREKLP